MKVGVIGTGNMGENHVRTYLTMPDHCQLVGIYDNDEENGYQIAKKYKVKQFKTMNNLLQSVDAVSIAVPTEFHYDIGLICIQYKVHMLMEKPITSTVTQAEDLLKKSIQAGVKLQVGHIELFNPLIQFLAKELENEDMIGIEFQRMSPYDEKIKNVDVVQDLMIHDLYILQELLKDKMTKMYAIGQNMENTVKHAIVIARSSQGVMAQLKASFKSKRKVRTIQVLTRDALIEADILKKEIKITRSIVDDSNAPVTVTRNVQIDDMIQPLRVQLLDFIDCINLDLEPSVSGQNGIEALEITNEISQIIRKGNI